MHSKMQTTKECYMCGSTNWLELHHVFNASNRNKSTKYGLVVYLCHWCHNEPPNGVHHNAERMRWLKAEGQKAFIKHYPNLDFLKIFGRNYL